MRLGLNSLTERWTVFIEKGVKSFTRQSNKAVKAIRLKEKVKFTDPPNSRTIYPL